MPGTMVAAAAGAPETDATDAGIEQLARAAVGGMGRSVQLRAPCPIDLQRLIADQLEVDTALQSAPARDLPAGGTQGVGAVGMLWEFFQSEVGGAMEL